MRISLVMRMALSRSVASSDTIRSDSRTDSETVRRRTGQSAARKGARDEAGVLRSSDKRCGSVARAGRFLAPALRTEHRLRALRKADPAGRAIRPLRARLRRASRRARRPLTVTAPPYLAPPRPPRHPAG